MDKDALEPGSIQPAEMGKVLEFAEVGRLHHRYERRAAQWDGYFHANGIWRRTGALTPSQIFTDRVETRPLEPELRTSKQRAGNHA